MVIIVVGVEIESVNTYIKCKTNEPVDINSVFHHEKTGFYFKTTKIEVMAGQKEPLIILRQYGSRRYRMTTSAIALSMILEPLELVTDQENLKKIEQLSRLC